MKFHGLAIITAMAPIGLNAFRISKASQYTSQRFFKTPSKLASSFTSVDDRSVNDDVTTQMIQESINETKKVETLYKNLPSPPTIWKTKQDASSFVSEKIDTILFDCDGVLYRTLDPCPGASECIKSLLENGKKVLFVTNNAGVNRRQLRDKLSKLLNIDSLTNEQMVSSSYSCAQYLKQHLEPGSRVHVIGSSGFCEELENSGFRITGGPSNDSPSMDREELAEYPFEEDPIDAIAIGHDTEFSFRKLCIANNLMLRNPNALFVATNHDSFDLVGSDGRHIPGNGCAVKALEYCSRRKSINVGKPSKTLADLIANEHNLDPSRCLFVGDRLDTDIRFGNENGMKSLLVMTGVTTADILEALGEGNEEEPLPNFVLPYVGMMI